MRDDSASKMAPWDPVWEFILDDYEDLDTRSIGTKTRFRFLRRKKEKDPGFFDMLFDDEDDYSDEDSYSERRGWFDSRSDRNEADRRYNSKASKRQTRRENSSNVGSDMWDLFGFSQSNPSAISGRRPSPSTKSNRNYNRQGSTRSGANQRGSTVANERSATGKRFFRRFQRRKSDNETSNMVQTKTTSSPATIPVKKRTTDTAKTTLDSKKRLANAAAIPKTTRPNPPKSKVQQQKSLAEDLNPFGIFLENTEKLGPLGADQDSNSESSSGSNSSSQSDEETIDERRVGTAESVSRPPTRIEEPEREVTEIRLSFTPMREDPIENDFRNIGNSHTEISSMRSLPANSVLATRKKGDVLKGLEEAREDISLRHEDAPSRAKFPSEKRQNTVEASHAIFFDKSDFQDDASIEPPNLMRMACCSISARSSRDILHKLQSRDILHKLQSKDALAIFPATKMISDDNVQFSAVTQEGADYVNGVMGVPSDRFVQAKGPQSIYEYEYSSEENMDVFYTSVGLKPRTSMVVRKLGVPPALDAESSGRMVVIKVEASAVSELDCIIRQGKWWGSQPLPNRNTPGVSIVGKVYEIRQQTEAQFHLQPRQTVLSLTKWGGNSRFKTLKAELLVKVPKGIDPAEAACLPEVYLTAFQVLHFGQVGSTRYKTGSLRGKSVLIVGSMANNMGKAIIELALSGGAANIYATSKKKHWKTLISFGIMPLSEDPSEWISRIEGTIDLILASNGPLREDVTSVHFRALHPKEGHLIICGRRVEGNDIPVGEWSATASLVCTKNKQLSRRLNRSHSYDVFEQWDRNLELCKKDIQHLLALLRDGVIKPSVLDRIPLNKVAKAHELIESKRLSGFLICEPWLRGKKRAIYL